MLVIVMTLGEVLFNYARSRPPWFAALFLFGRSLTSRFFVKQASVRAAIQADHPSTGLLQTIFPYRGEAWVRVSGDLSQSATLRQRDRDTLLVLVFLVIRYRAVAAKRAEARALPNQ